MDKPYVVVFSGGLEEYLAPRYFATKDEAIAELEMAQSALRDPSNVKAMVLVPLV